MGLRQLSWVGACVGVWLGSSGFAWADEAPPAGSASEQAGAADAAAAETDSEDADVADIPKGQIVSDSGLQLNLSVGYLLPVGRFERGFRIHEAAPAMFPLIADIGYRINPHWFIALNGMYAVGVTGRTPQSKCPDCNHNMIRVGLSGEYRTPLTPGLQLSIAVSSGIQFFNTTIDQTLQKSRRVSGWSLADVRATSEWTVTPGFSLGPYLSAGIGTFSTETSECASTKRVIGGGCPAAERQTERSLPDSGLNFWFGAGVRASVLP